jgi:cell division protein FtsB
MATGAGKKFYLLFLLAVVVVLGLILAYSDHGLMRLRELQQKKQKIEADNEKLREENRRLLHQIERIKTDPRYIEDEARKKLGLIRPDETIYRLKEEPDVSGHVEPGG